MKLDRVELADIRVPRAIARALHGQMSDAGPRVDVEAVARALGIDLLKLGVYDGFAGMLLTNRVRSRGGILANTRHRPKRARFTVAHELGHFLMEWHHLTDDTGFRCRYQDMRETKEGRREQKQETQANQFAIELLVPVPLFEAQLSGDPDLRDAQRARDIFDISLEASVRRLVGLRPEALAAVWTHKGIVRYHHKGAGFPWITRNAGSRIASTTAAGRALANGSRGFTPLTEAHPLAWTDAPDVELWEQTRIGNDGHAVTLLWAEQDKDGEDGTENIQELGMPQFR